MRSLFKNSAALAALLAASSTFSFGAQAAEPAPQPKHSVGKPYAARNLPDRIVLSAGADAARSMAVAFRTDSQQTTAVAQIAIALDSPSLENNAINLTGTSQPIQTENGDAIYHHVRFEQLKPDTAYVYRLKGSAGWSEWLQFRTAKATLEPFTFLYFGDTQNDILSLASRVIREAFHSTKSPALVVHAGDLVAQRDSLVHDDEWGEWTQAGGYNYAIVPQLPATGNHEYTKKDLPNGQEAYALGPHWNGQFTLPQNGAAGVQDTTYFVDFQGVRFITLDGTAALNLGKLNEQTRWLDQTLASSQARWNIVTFHQPIFTCARPQDTEELKAAWKPIFDKRKVDLVLQGHDHCYSRLTLEGGKTVSAQARANGTTQGPVYMVSVVGSKMYGLNDRSNTQPDRVAEDTQLFQTVDVSKDRLELRTRTATGRLYDGFDLIRQPNGSNLLVETTDLLPVRRCEGAQGPDNLPCTARAKD